mgnify:CR=1 FL=1
MTTSASSLTFLLSLVLLVTFSSAFFEQGRYPYGLNPARTPFADVESKIIDARTCRDNYRIAVNRTTVDLNGVILLTEQCGLSAMSGLKFMIVSQNLTAYQLRLFDEYGYSVSVVANNTESVPKFNITWRLNV